MKRIIVIIFVSLIICGCSNYESINKDSLNIEEIRNIMLNTEYIIIDVRTKEEYDSGHIVGAVNIPYDEINESVDVYKSKTIFVYCKSGNRSNIAFNYLKELGYTVYDLGAYSKIDLPKE